MLHRSFGHRAHENEVSSWVHSPAISENHVAFEGVTHPVIYVSTVTLFLPRFQCTLLKSGHNNNRYSMVVCQFGQAKALLPML